MTLGEQINTYCPRRKIHPMLGKTVGRYTIVRESYKHRIPIILAHSDISAITARKCPHWKSWIDVHLFKNKSDALADFKKRVQRGF